MITYTQHLTGGQRVDPLGIEQIHDSAYGLGGAIGTSDPEAGLAVARRIRAGFLNIDGGGPDFLAPFGGFRRSGSSREAITL